MIECVSLFHEILKFKSTFDANTNHEPVFHKVIFTHCESINRITCVKLFTFEKTTVRKQTMFLFCGSICLAHFLTLQVNGFPTSSETMVTSSAESQEHDLKSFEPDNLQTSYMSPRILHSEALTESLEYEYDIKSFNQDELRTSYSSSHSEAFTKSHPPQTNLCPK